MSTDVEKEKILVLAVYKQDGQFAVETFYDSNEYEVYGFLKCFLKRMEENLEDSILMGDDADDTG